MLMQLGIGEILALVGGTTGLIIMIVISLVLGTIFLKIGLKTQKASNMGFGEIFLTNILNILVSYLCCIIAWFVIKARHKTSLGGAIVAWLIAALLPILISFGIVYLLVTAGILVS